MSLSELTANQIQDLLDSKERYFIEKFDSINQGYNSKSGGQGYTERNNLPPEEIIRKKQLQRIKYRETQKKYYLEHREEILNKRKAVSHIKRQRQILRDLEHPEKKDQRKKLHSDYMKSHRSEHKSRIQKRKQEAIKCQA